ncbi:MAG TPA: fibronectin type III domain-containing protein [Acidimicrobiales bacterium]|nr:fibronectin type III domain-containing protein [Acidimicrobiales bacterium]
MAGRSWSTPRIRMCVLAAAVGSVAMASTACGPGRTTTSGRPEATAGPGVVTPVAVPVETDLGTLGGDSSASGPAAVSGDIVVGQAETANKETHAFAYDLGAPSPRMRDLGFLEGSANSALPRSSATAISGNIVVGSAVAGDGMPHAFVYDLGAASPVMRDLGALPYVPSIPGSSGGPESTATATDGRIVVGESSGHSFIYDLTSGSPAMRDLGALDAGNVLFTGISGNILVGYTATPGPEREQYFYGAFAYDLSSHARTLRDLGSLGGTQTKALAVSGDIVVGVSDNHAFAYDLGATKPVMRDLGTLGGDHSAALTVSGKTVLGYSSVGPAQDIHAFSYDLASATPRMRDLGLLGDRYTNVTAASGAVMVGEWSTMPDGHSHAVAWNLAASATPPGAPTGLSGQAGDRSVTLSWVAPGSNGGRHITGYRVTPYLGGVAQPPTTFSSAATTQNITGLSNDRAYTFTVDAISAAGAGPPSTPSMTLSPSVVAATAPHSTGVCTGSQVSFYHGGYWLATAKGGVVGFNAPSCGSLSGQPLTSPVAAMAYDPGNGGYWIATADGAVHSFGPAIPDYGSLTGRTLASPVVAMSATRDGHGYWLVTADGEVFNFGDAAAHGSLAGRGVSAPVAGMAVTPDGGGYWLVTSQGGVFNFGDAGAYGSLAGRALSAPVVGMAAAPDGAGYWLAASDGGVSNFGSAQNFGPWSGKARQAPVVGIASDPAAGGSGYWLVTSAGEVYSTSPFGAVNFQSLGAPVVAIASISGAASQ